MVSVIQVAQRSSELLVPPVVFVRAWYGLALQIAQGLPRLLTISILSPWAENKLYIFSFVETILHG